jgi:hypothetical protein
LIAAGLAKPSIAREPSSPAAESLPEELEGHLAAREFRPIIPAGRGGGERSIIYEIKM